ncbi:MAG TPA: HAMP domain-containing sensor histidine kinase [Patescibacteria group bacterium]|nr:HAMP domain-containing sensor histidine kinase [Patescibacteria group bacterium]
MFEKARLKLTAYYLAIIMLVSILFSAAIYYSITNEFRRFERMQIRYEQDISEDQVIIPPPDTGRNLIFRVGKPDPAVIRAARTRILLTLAFINLGIFGLAGALGYFLAGRTLRPIKKMVDEQNRFITDASHELRTPLTSLRTEIEVALREDNLTDKEARKIMESNLEEVVSLQALSDSLIELAQNGKLINRNNFENIELSDILNIAVKKVEPQAKKKGILIQKKIGSFEVFGIKDRLTEVFVILLDNAVKYSTSKKDIKISTTKDKDKVIVDIIDHGIGIEKEDLTHIFDRFYRSDKSRSKTNGYGLGLSIAKKIIESHNGTISVESVVGKQTKFSVVLDIIT